MPTPSDQPTSVAEVISTRTCPPEVDRISAWRDSPESVGTAGDAIEDALSPASATAPSVQSRSDDGTTLLATDPLRVERKMTTAEEEAGPGRASSPADSCPRSQSPVTPPNSSLLRYEFSNVRVSPRSHRVRGRAIDQWYSFCPTIPHRFFARVANLSAPSSPTARSTMLTWRSSTWTWPSLTSVAIFAYKVGEASQTEHLSED